MNYAYLSGYLESTIRNLAYDEKFFKIKNHEDRTEYLKKLVIEANEGAIAFEKTMKTKTV